MKPQGYKVLKSHSGFKKGSIRKMHPNLAEMLADRGLVEIPGRKPEKVEEAPIKEASVISTKSVKKVKK